MGWRSTLDEELIKAISKACRPDIADDQIVRVTLLPGVCVLGRGVSDSDVFLIIKMPIIKSTGVNDLHSCTVLNLKLNIFSFPKGTRKYCRIILIRERESSMQTPSSFDTNTRFVRKIPRLCK